MAARYEWLVPKIKTPAALYVWNQTMKIADLFPKALGKKSCAKVDLPSELTSHFSALLNKRVCESALNQITLGGNQKFFPIEFFKHFPDIVLNQETADGSLTFHSSGTTAQSRSLSYFSSDGLELYRTHSIRTFIEVLSTFFDHPLEVTGLSLIPSISEWPTSSLAKMIEWFSRVWKVQYVTEASLAELISSGMQQPIWLFGTAAHFASFRRKPEFALPDGSVIIETGGSKAMPLPLSRQELYEHIVEAFKIPQNHIISEYGMCELASQAYDWVDRNNREHCASLDKRVFRFPSWIKLCIASGLNTMKSSGIGALAIYDPLRIDCPLPIRTEDLVELSSHGTFKLIGRVPHAVLKGCSLLVDAIAHPALRPRQELARRVSRTKNNSENCSGVEKRALSVIKDFANFLDQNHLLANLTTEFQSENIARSALGDIKSSFPTTATTWSFAAQAAVKSAYSWLIIPPSNHSITLFYPLLLAYVAGLNVACRRTNDRLDSTENILLDWVKSLPDSKISTLPKTYRLGNENLPEMVEAILCYGSDETIREIKRLTMLPVIGFGSTLTFCIDCLDSIFLNSALIVKDCFSLAQLGCYSSRLVLLIGDPDYATIKKIQKDLVEKSRSFIRSDLSIATQTALDHEQLACSLKGAAITREKASDPLFPAHVIKDETDISRALLSERQFVVPLLFISKSLLPVILTKVIESFPDLRKLTVSDHMREDPVALDLQQYIGDKVTVEELGRGNAPKIDGYHDGVRLFCF